MIITYLSFLLNGILQLNVKTNNHHYSALSPSFERDLSLLKNICPNQGKMNIDITKNMIHATYKN